MTEFPARLRGAWRRRLPSSLGRRLARSSVQTAPRPSGSLLVRRKTTGSLVPGPSRLARVRRKPERARYDMAAVHAVLDAAPFCHVATVRDGRPVVLPMAHARLGDALILHGSVAAGLLRDMRRASPVCVTATLLDGLVFARSARNHSMNYRSVTVHGQATAVTEPEEIMAGMRALIEHIAPGRWEQVRQPTIDELRDTGLWRVPIEDASVKSRTGPTIDPQADLDWPVWAGHVPAGLTFAAPVAADGLPDGVSAGTDPSYVNPAFSRRPD
jgi:nitroimidazol reductase NimA-like FMN-containing flavoprotein (pyridoxamine 5'-phosphate oxidase superfamily)